jgi:WS/DGAT/MGAT family acyltransferase
MQQLSGMDNLFIQVERQGLPQHIGGVGIFDPSTAAGGKVRFKDIVDLFASRSHLSPIFRRKLVDVPFGLDRPYWVEDQEFDPEFHVRHIALPQPGDWRQLCILTARIHARPLDLSRPLWEAYVIEGLNNVEGVPAGSFALLTKIHHSVMDGVSGMQFYGALMDATPAPRSVEPTPQVLERIPSNAELFTKAYINNLRKPKQVLQFLKEVLGSRARLKSGREQHSFHELGDIPKTRFQGKISKSRVVDAVQFDFAHFRAIKNRIAGATINDVALTVVAGAMRAYLDSKGELPEESLVAGCPVDVREDGERDADGNMVGYMYISMRTDIADPLQRLAAVHDESVSAKAYLTAFGPRTGIHLLDTVPSGIMTLALRAASITGLSDASVTNNTVVTNVPGAGTSYYLAGARSVRQMSLGTLLPNVGLFQTITSQVLDNKGTLFISFVACREMLPDPAFYAQCLRDSFAALHKAARAKPVKQGKTSKKRRR